MISSELLQILVCPETKQPVLMVDEAELGRLNELIEAGKLSTKGGTPVREKLQAALIRQDRLVVYQVRDDIPIMLVEEGIALTLGNPA